MTKRDNLNDSRPQDQAKEQTLGYEESSKFKKLPFSCSDNSTPYPNPENNILHNCWLTFKSLQYEIEDQKLIESYDFIL
jgi:hypothetical protein